MKANCDRWFFRNQDLNFHLQTHKKTELKCPHCYIFTTNTDKYLNDHIKSVHSTELPYKCEKYNKWFMYKQQHNVTLIQITENKRNAKLPGVTSKAYQTVIVCHLGHLKSCLNTAYSDSLRGYDNLQE